MHLYFVATFTKNLQHTNFKNVYIIKKFYYLSTINNIILWGIPKFYLLFLAKVIITKKD